MAPKLPVVSGILLVKVLVRSFGFEVVGREGSHVTLTNGSRFVTVPLHRELDRGTLAAILKDAGVGRNEFADLV